MRSVAIELPDLERAERFYTEVWNLDVVTRAHDVVYLRATGADHHVLAIHRGPLPAIRNVTLRARTRAALDDIAEVAVEAGGTVAHGRHDADDPAGGLAITVIDPHGRVVRVVYGDATHGDARVLADRPTRLAHAVLNSHDVPATQAFFEHVFGLVLADRTRIMAFMNCNSDHHSLAFADSDNDALNHIAFVMADIDSVMRGGGRMRIAGHAIEWGPGRHGPGDNVFNYFIDPFGVVIEYTAEVEQIDDLYRVGSPDDWTWPPGRVDQWGVSVGPTPELRSAQRAVLFVR